MKFLISCLILLQTSIEQDLLNSPQNAENFRYLTMKDINDKDNCFKVVSFVLNTVSLKNNITHPTLLDKETIKFDLRDYGILPKNYELIGRDSYIKDNNKLKKLTKSSNPLMKADVFIMKVMTAPSYYKVMGVSNLEDFRKRHNYQASNLDQAAIVIAGNVARNTRYIKRIPSISGPIYEAMDSVKIDYLTDLLSKEYDSIQVLAFNPNGLISYFAADAKNKAVDCLDANIAIDHSKAFEPDVMVKVARNCITCHGVGVLPIDDKIRISIKDGIKLKDKKVAERLTELFGKELPIKKDQEIYLEALKKTTGLESKEFTKAFVDIWRNYYKDLTSDQAAKELSMSVEEFRKYCQLSGNFYLIQLLFTDKIGRVNLDKILEGK